MLSATPRRLLLAALVLLAPAYDAAFLLPKRGGGQSSSAGAGASTQQEGGWRGGLGRLLAEAVEGVSGGPKKEGGAAAHPSLQRADELLRKVRAVRRRRGGWMAMVTQDRLT